jgi:hypothetical protein
MEAIMSYDENDVRGAAVPDDGIVAGATDSYRLRYGDNGLDFRVLTLPDPVPVGRQIIEAAGYRAVEQIALVALLPVGAMEDIRLGEPFDLRGRGVERVIGFQTDILFRGFLLGQDFLWGRREVRGEELYSLASLGEGEALYLDVPGGADIHIRRDSVVDLSAPGVERFISALAPVEGLDITIIFNGVVRPLRVRPRDLISEVVAAARPLFGNPGGDLVLIDPTNGRVLEPNNSIAQEGVRPGAQLQLRPRTVQGG